MLDKQVKMIKSHYKNSPDIVFRNITIKNKKIVLVFNDTLCSGDNINDFILKPLTNFDKKLTRDNILNHLENQLPESSIIDLKNADDLLIKIGSGFTILLFEKEKPFAIETRDNLSRNISEPLTEQTISGPKDAFCENYKTNIGLVRKRIKTSNLVLEEYDIGKETVTKVGILYMDNIIEKDLLKEVQNRIKNINIDGIFDSTYIREIIEDNHSVFPTIETSERPDTIAMALLDGKVCISVDGSPYFLIIPTFFTDLFHASEDNYQNYKNVTFTRCIRFLAFLIAIVLPAFYIAIITYNHETIPATLLINFAAQREGVPFPAIVEALGLTLVFEILRESDIRMPHLSGTAISILGAIVLGDAAVSAGIVSPIMVIVIALSAISSLMFSHIGMVNAIRVWRIIFMLFATLAGIIGVFLAGFLLTINLSSLSSIKKPYLYPLIPLNKKFLLSNLGKDSIKKDNKRMPILTNKNYTRSKL
ncbi:MAG: spore germination protein [bacterium]|nr:spore germination protein [bacterium]